MSRPSGRSASRLAAILDALPDALLLVDAAGTVVNANAVALDLFEGESAERLLGKPLATLLPGLGRAVATAGSAPAALPAGSSDGAAASAPRAPVRSPSERLAARRTDGTLFPAEVNTAKLPDEGDELALYVVRDLTGVLDVEAELRRQQRQIELILRAASEGIIGVDNEARIVLVNPAGARILRHRAGDLGGQDVHELIAHSAADGSPIPADRVLLIDSLRTGTKHRSSDEVLWRSDGTSVTVDMTTAPVREGDVVIGAVMTFEDNSEARASVRRARELADVLSDSLRAPLAAVLSELRNVAEHGIGELGPNVRQSLANATSELSEVAGLVDDIVDYQHMVIGDTPVAPRRSALSEVVEAAVSATTTDAAALGVELISHTADVEVSIDPQLFATMLVHLLADMINASPVGGKVVVTAARRGPVARIEIRGPHTGGGPLHLPIARAIVGQHGGTVTTHRIAGKGNTHVVEIPLERSADGGGDNGGGHARTAIANTGTNSNVSSEGASGARSMRAAVLPTSRVRTPASTQQESAASTASQTSTASSTSSSTQVKQAEKTNGHHTSHGADVRRPVVSAAANGQQQGARIPAQARSPLSLPGVSPMDLKPSRPLPTSDVWSRPSRMPSDSPNEAEAPETSPDFESEAADPHRPWQPAADTSRADASRAETSRTESAGAASMRPETRAGARAAAEPEVEVEDDFDDDDEPLTRNPPMPSRTTVHQPVRESVERASPAVPASAAGPASDEGMEPRPRGRRRAASPDADDEGGPAGQGPAASRPGTPFGANQVPADPNGDSGDRLIGTDNRNTGSRTTDSRGANNGRAADHGAVKRNVMDDAPTQRMPPIVVTDRRQPEPESGMRGGGRGRQDPAEPTGSNVGAGSAVNGRRAASPAGVSSNAANSGPSAMSALTDDDVPALLLWPEPDPTTLSLLDERGYEPIALDGFDALAHAMNERAAQRATRPSAVLVDPIAAPITRRGLRILRGAAISAGLPMMVTAGILGGSDGTQGPDPALLVHALTPPAVSLPRVLLVEARDDVAEAMTASLERQGMQVLHAATDAESVSRASDGVPDVVVMDLMQIRRRRTGIVEWLREQRRLTTTPIVVYTAIGTDSAEFSAALRDGNAQLHLAERAIDGDVSSRIGDLLAKICP